MGLSCIVWERKKSKATVHLVFTSMNKGKELKRNKDKGTAIAYESKQQKKSNKYFRGIWREIWLKEFVFEDGYACIFACPRSFS